MLVMPQTEQAAGMLRGSLAQGANQLQRRDSNLGLSDLETKFLSTADISEAGSRYSL